MRQSSTRVTAAEGKFAHRRALAVASACAGATVLLSGVAVQATMLSIPSSTFVTLTSGSTIPTGSSASTPLGNNGFLLYNFNGANTSVTCPYANIITVGTNYAGSAAYSTLTVGSTTAHTGLVYDEYVTTTATLATITVTSNASLVPYEFQIGLLDDNSSGSANDTAYTVNDVTAGTSVTFTDADTAGASNDFYLVDITDASPGDQIIISGERNLNGTENVCLGGITFDTIQQSAPEPASAAVLALSATALFLRRRGSMKTSI